jgi:hypothetical protein
MRSFVELFALVVLLLLAQTAFRRLRRGATWCCFLVVPALLTPFWLEINTFGLFPWVKLYTVLASACWLTVLRFTDLGRYGPARCSMIVILIVNILEAVTLDCSYADLTHALHACSGLLLAASLRCSPDTIDVDAAHRYRDLRYDGTTRGWIVGYTLWNATFIQINYPEIAAHQLVVLVVPLVVGMKDPSRWGQARTYTLATDLIVLATCYEPLLRADDRITRLPLSDTECAVGCFVVVLGYAAVRWIDRRKLQTFWAWPKSLQPSRSRL